MHFHLLCSCTETQRKLPKEEHNAQICDKKIRKIEKIIVLWSDIVQSASARLRTSSQWLTIKSFSFRCPCMIHKEGRKKPRRLISVKPLLSEVNLLVFMTTGQSAELFLPSVTLQPDTLLFRGHKE